MAPPPVPPERPPGGCTGDLYELEQVTDLHSGTAGAIYSSDALAYATASATALQMPAPAPGTTGTLHASLDNEQLGSASFAAAAPQASAVAVVLRTATVYAASDGVNDRDKVVVAVQLRDGSGNSAVHQTGLVVELKLTGSSTLDATCSADGASGLATCSVAVSSGWFGSSAGSASAEVNVKYGGTVVATSSALSVTLAAKPAAGSLSSSGMRLVLPSSPRFPGDAFDAAVKADIIGASCPCPAHTPFAFASDRM